MDVKCNPTTEWKFSSGLDDDDRILWKCHDTEDGLAVRVAHSDFADPLTPVGRRPKEII